MIDRFSVVVPDSILNVFSIDLDNHFSVAMAGDETTKQDLLSLTSDGTSVITITQEKNINYVYEHLSMEKTIFNPKKYENFKSNTPSLLNEIRLGIHNEYTRCIHSFEIHGNGFALRMKVKLGKLLNIGEEAFPKKKIIQNG